jgi:tRNA(Ile)-lysidine synthase
MLHQLHQIPYNQKFVLACSGGSDSMAVADFYLRGKKNFVLAYFNHGTPQAKLMENVVEKFAVENKLECEVGNLYRAKLKEESPEEYWRKQRYQWLSTLDLPVVTCHHLDDAVENWVFSSLHGNPKLISSQGVFNGVKIIRPFLLNKKSDLTKWCLDHKVAWFEDESNKNTKYPRNRIRHNMMPEILKINPGIYKVVKKKILQDA